MKGSLISIDSHLLGQTKKNLANTTNPVYVVIYCVCIVGDNQHYCINSKVLAVYLQAHKNRTLEIPFTVKKMTDYHKNEVKREKEKKNHKTVKVPVLLVNPFFSYI